MLEDSSPPAAPSRSSHTRCRDRDKALLVGIQYDSPMHNELGVAKLSYPHRDIEKFKEYLQEYEGYDANNIIVLVDQESQPPETMPTKANIVRI